MTAGQKSEQLFAKDTPEFYRQILMNLYELADFAANKKVKAIWFDPEASVEEKACRGMKLVNALDQIRISTDNSEICLVEYHILSELLLKLQCFHGREDDITNYQKLKYIVAEACNKLAEKDENI